MKLYLKLKVVIEGWRNLFESVACNVEAILARSHGVNPSTQGNKYTWFNFGQYSSRVSLHRNKIAWQLGHKQVSKNCGILTSNWVEFRVFAY